MSFEYKIIPGERFRANATVMVHDNEIPTHEARMAGQLIERALTAAIEDGEDSAGRAKVRLQTPDELVSRSCDTAEKAIAEFRKRGWLLKAPDGSGDGDGRG